MATKYPETDTEGSMAVDINRKRKGGSSRDLNPVLKRHNSSPNIRENI